MYGFAKMELQRNFPTSCIRGMQALILFSILRQTFFYYILPYSIFSSKIYQSQVMELLS